MLTVAVFMLFFGLPGNFTRCRLTQNTFFCCQHIHLNKLDDVISMYCDDMPYLMFILFKVSEGYWNMGVFYSISDFLHTIF